MEPREQVPLHPYDDFIANDVSQSDAHSAHELQRLHTW